jgi:hypothetical protein
LFGEFCCKSCTCRRCLTRGIAAHALRSFDARSELGRCVCATSGITGRWGLSPGPRFLADNLGFEETGTPWHRGCYIPGPGDSSMHHLQNKLFWDKKVKIALLALATFIAMC